MNKHWMRIVSTVLLVALMSMLVMPVTAQRNGLLTDIPVEGTIPGGTFEGVLSVTGFAFENGQLLVSGVLEGTATVGGIVTEISQTFTRLVGDLLDPDGGQCDILFLDLGPIFLDLLGLEVDLSQIILDVRADPGPGNLLGNLLCSVTRLLDGGGTLSRIGDLLNRINELLSEV